MEEKTEIDWYKNLQLKEVKIFIQDNINSASRSFVAIGYYLKYVRDHELFCEDGYSNIWEFAQSEFGIGKSQSSKFMAINDKFSVDGNSPVLMEQYRNFSSSKLSEMLYLTDEQLQQVTAESTVAEIREIKKPEQTVSTSKQEKVQALIDDLDFTVNTYNCLKRAGIDTVDDLCDLTESEVIRIRNISRRSLDEIKEKVSGIGRCLKVVKQVGLIAPKRPDIRGLMGDPYCPECGSDLEYKQNCEDCGCLIDWESVKDLFEFEEEQLKLKAEAEAEKVEAEAEESEPEQIIDADYREILEEDLQADPEECEYEEETVLSELEEIPKPKFSAKQHIQDAIKNEEEQLDEMREYWSKNRPDELLKHETILLALKLHLTDMEYPVPEPVKAVQPDLPILENNDQRKEWIEAYATWPIWVDLKETGERYYRYDFDNGESFVIRVSLCRKYLGWQEGYSKDVSFGREEYFLLKSEMPFRECEINKSAMIEYLKETQKK